MFARNSAAYVNFVSCEILAHKNDDDDKNDEDDENENDGDCFFVTFPIYLRKKISFLMNGSQNVGSYFEGIQSSSFDAAAREGICFWSENCIEQFVLVEQLHKAAHTFSCTVY